MTRRRTRFWIEAGLTVASILLLLVTLISREWIEIVFGVDPDHGNGLLEWFMVGIVALAAVVFSVITRIEWQRTPHAPPGPRAPTAD